MKRLITCLFVLQALATLAQGLNEGRLWKLLHSTENFEEAFEEIRSAETELPSLLGALKLEYGDSVLVMVGMIADEANDRDFDLGMLLLNETIELYGDSKSPEFLLLKATRAWLLMNMGQYEESLRENLEVLKSAETAHMVQVIPHVKLQLASIYEEIEEYELAIQLFVALEQELIAARDTALLMNLYVNSMSTYGGVEDLQNAIRNGEKALQLAETLDLPDTKSSVLGNLAWCYFSLGDYQKAIEYQSRGLEIEIQFDNRLAMIDSYGTLAITYSKLGDEERTLFYAEKCIALAKSQKSYPKLLDTYYYGSEMSVNLGDYESAHEYAWLYHNLYDSLLGIEKNGQIAELREKYESEKKEIENQSLKAENRLQKLLLIGIGIFSVFLVGFGIMIYRANRKTKKLYAQLSAQAFELNKANKTKDRLFSIIGHDLRGPITSFETANGIIKNYLEERRMDKADQMISHIDRSVKSLKMLLDNLLNWSLSQQEEMSLNIQRLEIKPIIEEVFALFKDPAEFKRITLAHTLLDERIMADRDTITTVFRNLISNAIKFSPEHSEILIEREMNGNFIEITVKDKGVGMSKEQLGKLFNIDKSKVRRGTAQEKGSGLGLVLVKEFVELNRGTIHISSEPGKGSVFSISLPLAS